MSLLMAVAATLAASGGGGDLSATITDGTSVGGTVANGSQSYGSSTCTPSGGVPPYTYLWEKVSGDDEIQPVFPTGATTQWNSDGTDQSFAAVWRCKVTDNATNTVYTDNTVSISVTHGTPP